jgi:hypothetical protein
MGDIAEAKPFMHKHLFPGFPDFPVLGQGPGKDVAVSAQDGIHPAHVLGIVCFQLVIKSIAAIIVAEFFVASPFDRFAAGAAGF